MKPQKNILLRDYTTFQIGGPAQYFFSAKTKNDLIKAISWAEERGLPYFILGGGSNLLVADRGYRGLVIKLQNANYRLQATKVFAEAAVMLGELVMASAEAGLSGLEWAGGIPGTVGGAIRGNAGAFGTSMQNLVKVVEVIDVKNKKIKSFKNKDCQFAYRNSIFKKNPNFIILSAELKLKRENREKIKKRIEEYLNYRRQRHISLPSAGSVFKNIELEKLPKNFFRKFPEAKQKVKENVLPTAYLIAECGLLGKKKGGAMISRKHPNFIVNFKGAKAREVLWLINLIKKSIKNKFGIIPEEEICFLGF
jgi:UDP-N-acetylmuramate dehydrogenase